MRFKHKRDKPERRQKIEALLKLAGDGAITPSQIAEFCTLADGELLLLWKMLDVGEHTCRYSYEGRPPCGRCLAEGIYYGGGR